MPCNILLVNWTEKVYLSFPNVVVNNHTLEAAESQLHQMICDGLPEGNSRSVLQLQYLALKRDIIYCLAT